LVRSNADQEGDGHIGGELNIAERGVILKTRAATNDNHFTMLGFAVATGEPIMCAMILEGEKLRGDWVTGIDMLAEEIRSVSDRDY